MAPKPVEFDPTEVERLAGYGLTQDQIADWHGCSDRTLRRHLETDPALASAYKKGRAKALDQVAGVLFSQATSGKNTAATIFYLKSQGHWSETQKIEHSGPDGTPLLEPEDRVNRVLEILRERG